MKKDANASVYSDFIKVLFGQDETQAILASYPLVQYPAKYNATSEWWATTHIFGDAQMTCAARRTAHWLASAPHRTKSVYVYFFQHVMEALAVADKTEKSAPKGVCHGSELVLVFRDRELMLGAGEDKLSDQVQCCSYPQKSKVKSHAQRNGN